MFWVLEIARAADAAVHSAISQSSQSFSLSEGSSTLKIACLVAIFVRFRFDALPTNPVRLTGISTDMNRFSVDSRASGYNP